MSPVFLRRIRLLAASLLAAAALSACGQTGPLYLPGESAPKTGLSIRPDTRAPADERREQAPSAAPAAPQAAPAAPPAASSVAAPATGSR